MLGVRLEMTKEKIKCNWCNKKAMYIVEDNEKLKGYQKICKEHLLNAVRNAFAFNFGNKKKDDFITVKMLSRLTVQDKRDYDII